MRLVVDENMAAAQAAFEGFGDLVLCPGRAIGRLDLAGAEALLVRSVTRVGADLLAGSPVRFVGSATSGFDHVDRTWLAEHGVAFAYAPGCNAAAVADWVVAALAVLAVQGRHAFGQGTVGLVGAGHVGRRVAARLAALGYELRVCDPPRAEAEGSAGFVDLAAALDSDVVTLHVPRTRDGPHATLGMVDAAALETIPAGAVLLNAARGGVVDEDALASRLDDGPELQAVLDTWSGEPQIDADLLARVALGTPHIAGYSLEGRLRGTAMVAAAAGAHFGIEPGWDWHGELPPAPTAPTDGDVSAILSAYDPRTDDTALRGLLRLPPGERAGAFDALRRDYPMRREFGFHAAAGELSPMQRAAGFGQPED